MKKLILLTSVLLIALTLSGQALQKGNLVGIHVCKLVLQPDVTYNQWKDFMLMKYIPKGPELDQDVNVFLLEGKRGENEYGVALLYVFKSEAARDKYFNKDGSQTELWKQFNEKIKPLNEERAKLEKSFSTIYTDWIVQ